MEQIFTTHDKANDLIDWADKLHCIGGAIEALGGCNDNETLSWYGPGMGMIVRDYAHALKVTVEESYSEISQALGNFDFSSKGKIDRRYKRIKQFHDCPARDEKIKENLEEVQDFIKEISGIFEIEQELKKMLGLNGNTQTQHTTILREDR